MTHTNKKTTFCKIKSQVMPVVALLLILLFALKLSGDIRDDVRDGIRVATLTVIPTSMPFMVVADLYRAYGKPHNLPFISRAFSKIFGIDPRGVGALICGNLSGFPIGAKLASDLYIEGDLSKIDAEKLCAFSNNPSIPFIIFAVGDGLFQSQRIGIFLLATLYISVFSVMLIFKKRGDFLHGDEPTRSYNFSFIDSVKNAGTASVAVASFIIIFFAAIGIAKRLIRNDFFFLAVASLLEVTSGVSSAVAFGLPIRPTVAVTSFALSFGGISVMMQSGIFTKSAGLSLKKYLAIKLLQGAVGFFLSYSLYPIFFE